MPLRRMPSLNALRAFEAAARRGSFKGAAEELSVTPGAISQQIKALEADLGVALFRRKTRAIELTTAGQALQPRITDAFLQMRQAVDAIRPASAQVLRIDSSAPIIIKWLLPRLHLFTDAHPELNVQVETHNSLIHLDEGGPDVVIRFTQQVPRDLFARKLFDEMLLVLAAPQLVERLDLQTPEDLSRAHLIHDSSLEIFGQSEHWQRWFNAAGLGKASARGRVQFEKRAADYGLDMAAAGGGVLLGRALLAFGALREGRLICPFGPVLDCSASYFVACRKGREAEPHVAAFIEWVEKEAALLSTLNALKEGVSAA